MLFGEAGEESQPPRFLLHTLLLILLPLFFSFIIWALLPRAGGPGFFFFSSYLVSL